MKESRFQSALIKELYDIFDDDCVVLKNDTSYIQGIPDLLILFKDKWAALEVKESLKARRQPNQEYYVDILDNMSFAAFICPENKEEILDALQRSLKSARTARVLRS